MPLRPTMLLSLLCWSALSACSADPPRLLTQIRIERIAPPAALLTCDPWPPAPAEPTTQRDVAAYLVDGWAAWSDCSDRLRAVRAFVEDGEPPAPRAPVR